MSERMRALDKRHLRLKNAMAKAGRNEMPVQRQDSTTDQLYDLWLVSTKLGMYDAADWLWKNVDLGNGT